MRDPRLVEAVGEPGVAPENRGLLDQVAVARPPGADVPDRRGPVRPARREIEARVVMRVEPPPRLDRQRIAIFQRGGQSLRRESIDEGEEDEKPRQGLDPLPRSGAVGDDGDRDDAEPRTPEESLASEDADRTVVARPVLHEIEGRDGGRGEKSGQDRAPPPADGAGGWGRQIRRGEE